MRLRNSLLAVGILCLAYLPVYGSSGKQTGPESSTAHLRDIRREAAKAQQAAEEIATYVRHTDASRQLVAERVAYLAGHVKKIQSSVARFEATKPKLPPGQSPQLERIERSLTTLIAFTKVTIFSVREPHGFAHSRDDFSQLAAVMAHSSKPIRAAARELVVTEPTQTAKAAR